MIITARRPDGTSPGSTVATESSSMMTAADTVSASEITTVATGGPREITAGGRDQARRSAAAAR